MGWLIAVLFGGFVGLDASSFPQAMYSRPFVAGAIGGFLMGRPVEGVVIGIILEVFSLPVLPFGATAYPEGGTAAVASVVAYDWATPVPDMNLLFLAIAFGLPLSHATGYSVRLLRLRNGRAVRQHEDGAPIDPDALERTHLHAMGLDFVRGAVVTGAGAALLTVALELAATVEWMLPLSPTNVLVVATAMMIGGTISIFGTLRERVVSFLVGAAITALALGVL